ncbi:IS630 family transposase [Aquimarina aquimarini]|uniref:IS630 family transposase n=1 Tax=Aquimarina aquimarini TaxID=1191734 RepID=UPI0021043A67|nr:IS630 family transposase [Aquimarina aquimarini]
MELNQTRLSLDKDTIASINLYFQDESRFGLMTHTGRCLTSKGVKPIVKYQHAFKNTYLYGIFSPINGDAFIYEIEGTASEIFYKYLVEFSKYKPTEFKVIIIDNAGFHSMKNYQIPDNIALIRIPPYTPELNPAEKVWAYIKQYYKNKVLENLNSLKEWLHNFINDKLNENRILGITYNSFFNQIYNEHLEI